MVEESEVGEKKEEFIFCLVGRFLTDKNVHFAAMHNTLATLWRPIKGVSIRDLGSQIFLFQFFHEVDIQRVEKGGPWTFNKHLLLMKRLEPDEQLTTVPLIEMSIWVQLHELPIGFMFEKVCQQIGSFIGKFIESDTKNFDGVWKSYLQVRVMIDIRRPLEMKMKLKQSGGEWL